MNREVSSRVGALAACVVLAMLVGTASCTAPPIGGSSVDDSASSPTAPTPPSPSPTPTPTPTGLTYTNDIRPILNADCISCHSGSRPSAGYNLSSYAGVMTTVSAGNANSRLVRATTSGGSMYGLLSGSRATKSATILSWVVDSKAAQ